MVAFEVESHSQGQVLLLYSLDWSFGSTRKTIFIIHDTQISINVRRRREH
jgi:hypothetical protein